MAQAFFKPTDVSDATLNGYVYRLGQEDCPILADVPAWFECQVVDNYKIQGDHIPFLGLVTTMEVEPDAGPTLTVHDTPWTYGR
ncbi:MAG: hypothetical protein GY774_05695 [Planctomycetes bacterium]|nr:hypothetical protein [Planctomycetota bacterium]